MFFRYSMKKMYSAYYTLKDIAVYTKNSKLTFLVSQAVASRGRAVI